MKRPSAGVRCFVSTGGKGQQVCRSILRVLTTTPPGAGGVSEPQAEVEPTPLPFWKRPLDIGVVLLAAPAALAIFLFFWVYLKLVSPGPVFFKQERVGRGGRKFLCFKFRTMRADNNVGVHRDHLADLMKSNRPMQKLDSVGDQRILPLGRLVRATGVDELPQLINVWWGEMSVVGPRPCTPYEFDLYEPWHKERCAALPGLTGLWQVSGKNRTTFEEMILLDIKYARHPSLWQDLKIIAKTIPALLGQVQDQRKTRRCATAAVAPQPASEHSV
jgi:exopolysaccharide production protein ExoY